MTVADIVARRTRIDLMFVNLGMHNELHKLYYDVLSDIATAEKNFELEQACEKAKAALGINR